MFLNQLDAADPRGNDECRPALLTLDRELLGATLKSPFYSFPTVACRRFAGGELILGVFLQVDGRRDPACVFPLATLRAALASGTIGALPDNVISVMGANYSMSACKPPFWACLWVYFGVNVARVLSQACGAGESLPRGGVLCCG